MDHGVNKAKDEITMNYNYEEPSAYNGTVSIEIFSSAVIIHLCSNIVKKKWFISSILLLLPSFWRSLMPSSMPMADLSKASNLAGKYNLKDEQNKLAMLLSHHVNLITRGPAARREPYSCQLGGA